MSCFELHWFGGNLPRLYEYSVWTDFDEKLLGGAGGSVPRNPLRAPKTEVGTEVGTWVGEVTHQDPPNRELAHRGGMVGRGKLMTQQ